MSSANVTQDLKWLCSEILCNTCRSHDVLPTSWAELNVVSGGVHMSGTFTDVHKGHHAGNTVRIMTFRAQPPKRMGNIRRVGALTISGTNSESLSTGTIL